MNPKYCKTTLWDRSDCSVKKFLNNKFDRYYYILTIYKIKERTNHLDYIGKKKKTQEMYYVVHLKKKA